MGQLFCCVLSFKSLTSYIRTKVVLAVLPVDEPSKVAMKKEKGEQRVRILTSSATWGLQSLLASSIPGILSSCDAPSLFSSLLWLCNIHSLVVLFPGRERMIRFTWCGRKTKERRRGEGKDLGSWCGRRRRRETRERKKRTGDEESKGASQSIERRRRRSGGEC